MCGFFCVYDPAGGLRDSAVRFKQAGQIQSHRGPDNKAVFIEDRCAIYFHRLGILDLSERGNQPMVSDDGRLIIGFNGEIYNAPELKRSLEGLNHTFQSTSDTEVLLRAYQQYGLNALDKLQGMFSFIVWDRKEQRLTAVRDRIGIKPLYVARSKGQVILSSEIKSIVAYLPSPPEINEKTVHKYISRRWLDDTSDTFFSGIESIPAGFYMSVASAGVFRRKYWQLEINKHSSVSREMFEEKLDETVRTHLQSDVPIGIALSGGMDSSSIATLASRAIEGSAITGFSVMPPHTYDESEWVDQVVRTTGIKHTYVNSETLDIANLVDQILSAHDEPFQHANCIYHYHLRQHIAEQGIRVLLVGDGGDETLGGYRRLSYPFLYSLQQKGFADST